MASSLGLKEWSEALSVLRYSASSCPGAPKLFQLLRKGGAPGQPNTVALNIIGPKLSFPVPCMYSWALLNLYHTNQGDPPVHKGVS